MSSSVEYENISLGRERIRPNQSVRKALVSRIRGLSGRHLADVRWNEQYGAVEIVVRDEEWRNWAHWDLLYNGKNIRDIELGDIDRVVTAYLNTRAPDPLEEAKALEAKQAEALSVETNQYEDDAIKDAKMMERRHGSHWAPR